MDRAGAGSFGRCQDLLGAQIALGDGCGANRDRFVREPRVHGVAIRLRAHRDGTHAERASGPNDAAGNLAAIGDQQRFHHGATS
jgi:hypothetical protein